MKVYRRFAGIDVLNWMRETRDAVRKDTKVDLATAGRRSG